MAVCEIMYAEECKQCLPLSPIQPLVAKWFAGF